MITKSQIINELYNIDLAPNMEIEVHSSLSNFGYVYGGANTVINELKEVITPNGSIFIPALRLSHELTITEKDKQLGITCKIQILSPDEPHSAMGIIADTFRQMPETYVGNGVFRVSAWGKNAEKSASGFQYLIDNGGQALLLGVDIYKLTAMHYVEHLLPEKIKNFFKPSEEINKLYPPEKWFIETWTPPVKPWYTIQELAYKKGVIKNGLIENCHCMFFNIWDVVDIYQQELKNNPYKLYGLE